MNCRFLVRLSVLQRAPRSFIQKARTGNQGEVASMDVIRTPVGKKIVYRYSYTVHASGHSYSFDETKKLQLTVNGSVRFAVNGDKLRVVDERGKEHKETVLEKAVDKK